MANDTQKAGPVQLHVVHDLGGGIEKWLGDYTGADSTRRNLVLRSFAQGTPAGAGLALYESHAAAQPLQAWTFATPIEGATASHPEYRAAFAEVIARYGVGVVIVSSLVGHSLDALESGKRTLVVTHDYFPYCPSINLFFGRTCIACDADRVADCHRDNPDYNAFPGFSAVERMRVRDRYLELLRAPGVSLVAPSRSVIDNFRRIEPLFEGVDAHVIPHGDDHPIVARATEPPAHGDRLRVLVLGQLSHAKGLALLRDSLPALAEFAEVFLLGAGEVGELFRHQPHVHVVARFARDELPGHVASIHPHVGLLASVVEETFNYALSELQMMGVPVAATRRGSFPERIRDGETGYLYEPEPAALEALLRGIDADRYTLDAIRQRLRGWKPRTAREMVADYHRLAPATDLPAPSPSSIEAPDLQRAFAAQAVTAAGIWKELKGTSLQLALVSEARDRAQRAFDEERRAARAHIAELEEAGATAAKRIEAQERSLAEHGGRLAELTAQLQYANARLDETFASTSWRISAPVRVAGRASRKLKLLARCLAALGRDREALGDNSRRLVRAWRAGGLHEVKKTLLDFAPAEGRRDAWMQYRATFRQEVRPRIQEAVAAMARRPRVSILVPTYNTPEPMLRQMLRSVEEQLYPEWELCIADDGSSEPHVARVLREAAARDARIKLDLATQNRGVSNASNRALALATGDFVVLLDHDDILEEQATFRVAEAVLADDPDMLYSDEALVSVDGGQVKRYALRPAFSLEYLRSHPYIVHLVGFRPALLKAIGGFDERLRISQDYDLILRAAEQAKKVVHIPEILYQWRLHETSTGMQKQDEVMATSSAILERHLERSGVKGRVTPGARFNLFETRYPLQEGLKVAVIIPTKNRGELVRQCIDSLRATTTGVPYDIFVVDHQSDEPATLGYLASIASQVTIVPYQGSFNFSAINNRAVAAAEARGGYSHYLLLNNDVEAMQPGWLERMLELGQQPDVGIVGALLMYGDRRSIQHAGVIVGAYGAAEHYAKRLQFPGDPVEPGFAEMLMVNHEVAAVTTACLLIRRDAWQGVGGLDETIEVGFNDVDLCLKALRLGYRVVFCPHAVLVHHESLSRGTSTVDPHPEDSRKYLAKWRGFIDAGDPYYHPGLSLTSSNWSLRQPLPCRFEIRRRVVEPALDGGLQRATFSPAAP